MFSPVETKPYVFTRNMFAVIAISLIIFRTIVGLLQARDTYEPRIRSSDCNYDSLDGSKLQILMVGDLEITPSSKFSSICVVIDELYRF